MKSRSLIERAGLFTVVAIASVVLAPIIVSTGPWPEAPRDFLVLSGYRDTGASNLVSAIYLGYRAYDTIGETIVLVVALAGSMALVSGAPAGKLSAKADTSAAHRATRTEIIDVVSGKLAPIVLLFGCYVMLYGHISPGGGFQGGVVLASGIVFIAIGRKEGGLGGMDPKRRAFSVASLAFAEAFALSALLLLTFSGALGGSGFTGNPIPVAASLPPVAFIIAMNIAIGLKVGSGVALLCILMLSGGEG